MIFFTRFVSLWLLSASLLACLITPPLQAQKVALVLSGGGAKGIAHLGVIKALEEHQIPIDYIIGTSMGGIIGGFYAAGYSVDELEDIVLSDAFQDWVSGRVSGQYRYRLYQKDPNASLVSVRLALDSLLKPSLKSTIVKDYTLNFALAELLAQASAATDCSFDSLMIPFRCMAADVFTQEEIVLAHGILADALRATMSVPLFFNPIRVQGRYLFDGGIYDNFPVEKAKQIFSPDVVIGVNVSTKNFTEYPYQDDEKHLKDALFYLLLSKSDSTSLDSGDVFIEPSVHEFTALNFNRAPDFLRIGYEAGLRKIPEISQKISRRLASSTLDTARQEFRAKMPPFQLGQVSVTGLPKRHQGYIKNTLLATNKALSLEEVKRRYYRLVEADKFEALYPSFYFNEETQAYDFNLQVKPDRTIHADIGGNLSTRSLSALYAGIQYQVLNRYLYNFGVQAYLGNFYSSVKANAKINIPSRVPLYIEPFYVYNNFNYSNINELIFRQSPRQAILTQLDHYTGVNTHVARGSLGKFVFSGAYFYTANRYSSTSTFSSGDLLDFTRFEGARLAAGYYENTLNHLIFPLEGHSLEISGRFFIGNELFSPGTRSVFQETLRFTDTHQWFMAKFHAERYWGSRRMRLGYLLEAVLSNQPVFRNYYSSKLYAPSFFPLMDSRTLFLPSFRAPNYVVLGAKVAYRFNKNWHARLEAYAFNTYEPIIDQEQRPERSFQEFDYLRVAGSASLVYNTFVGPVSLQLNYYEEQRQSFSLLFNIGFLLFNPRPFD
ncbi:patatin-like phospholipase family protein [Eisenibacter elegans]|jgi:NTE family protein|uniref:patatin-like phospholipase family protein n=1 Tax=Eisenibacter elegans TaxID=997 RepID=UPI00040DAD5C|nr:patatin-like phospholipase family protein [Eisenibacter elegans]